MLLAGFLGDAFSPVLIAAGSGLLLTLAAVAGYVFSPGLQNYN